MTDQEVLNKAIDKAKENGWETNITSRNIGHEYQAIFSHSFAKSLWPEEHTGIKYEQGTCESCDAFQCDYGPEFFSDTCWKQHLAYMSQYDNPIEYLRKFIES